MNNNENTGIQQQPVKQTNGFAIAGFVLSFFTTIISIIFCVIGLVQSKKYNSGKGLSIAGIIIVVVKTIISIILVVLFSAAIVAATQDEIETTTTTTQVIEDESSTSKALEAEVKETYKIGEYTYQVIDIYGNDLLKAENEQITVNGITFEVVKRADPYDYEYPYEVDIASSLDRYSRYIDEFESLPQKGEEKFLTEVMIATNSKKSYLINCRDDYDQEPADDECWVTDSQGNTVNEINLNDKDSEYSYDNPLIRLDLTTGKALIVYSTGDEIDNKSYVFSDSTGAPLN